MLIQKRKEGKWAELKGEVSLYYEQRCFHFDWNHSSLQFGSGWWSHLPHWVLKMKSATSESSCFCCAPVKTEAPGNCHSSGAPCYAPSFRIHQEGRVELCQDACLNVCRWPSLVAWDSQNLVLSLKRETHRQTDRQIEEAGGRDGRRRWPFLLLIPTARTSSP